MLSCKIAMTLLLLKKKKKNNTQLSEFEDLIGFLQKLMCWAATSLLGRRVIQKGRLRLGKEIKKRKDYF